MTIIKAGVLALQGDFREHARALQGAGASVTEVRLPSDLSDVECLVIPGGESTTMGKLAHAYGLVEPVRDRAAAGMPIFGTCAGMIVLARRVQGGEPLFGLMDIGVQRNAYGRQVDSFEDDVTVEGIEHPVRGVFIRAPRITDVGPGVRVLAEHEGTPVVLQEGALLVSSFHPELVGETGLHRYLLELA
ncbi:MAG TPA: pyridoxal 5'-phosphate synthase glutaminase subunit PdxT [Actinomycetota bacterium]